MVKILRILRIIFKALVWLSAIIFFFMTCVYWLDGARLAAISLLSVATLTFIFVLKDHSEDWIRKKARDIASENEKDFCENAVMLIVYFTALIFWILAVAASFYLKP